MSGYNMAAAGMYGMFPNLYNNQIALNDLSGLNMYYPTGMYMDPALTMNGSIFGGMMNPMMGPMGCVPFMGNNGNYFDSMNNWMDQSIDYQVKYNEKMRDADLRINSPQEGVKKFASYLQEKIKTNEQEQIKEAYARFKESVRSLYPNASEEDLANRTSTLYAQCTGKSIVDDIRENGRDSLTQGFLQSVTFGLVDGKTAEENISELTGMPVGRYEKMKKIAGNAAGGAVVGGLGATLLGALFKFKCPKVGMLAALGAMAAGVFGGVKAFNN